LVYRRLKWQVLKIIQQHKQNNTSLNGISTAEGMLPSNLNNAIRALMKNTRDWYNDSQWVEYGDGSGAYTANLRISYFIYNSWC
jgi:hypothetical protein